MATIIDIADSVVAEINATTFSQPVTARRGRPAAGRGDGTGGRDCRPLPRRGPRQFSECSVYRSEERASVFARAPHGVGPVHQRSNPRIQGVAMIAMRAKTKFDKQKLLAKTKQANFKNLGHAGAALRLTARRSIRTRQKPSPPGAPPHTRRGH